MVYFARFGSHPLTAPLKYFCQFLSTLRILFRERPSAVFVMSPPLVAVLPVLLYKLWAQTPLVLDCHTAAYMHPRWKRLQWLQHFLGRRAATNIVTNDYLAELVNRNGGHATIVRDVPIIYAGSETFPLSDQFNVAVVCSFNPDEPIAEIFKAAESLPDVQFYMTGNPKHLKAAIAKHCPANVQLTGFLSDEAYGSLLSRASVVMSLTTRDHTMLRGAWEAIYQATPVIVSDWPCLREAFAEGAQFADNSPQGIVAAIRRSQAELESLKQSAAVARSKRIANWLETKAKLLQAIDVSNAN